MATEIRLYKTIGRGWDSSSTCTDKEFCDEVDAAEGDINLRINCLGGDVFMARAMHNALARYDGGDVIAYIDGVAASAATFVMMAADKIICCDNADVMIHRASGLAWGNRNDMQDTADLLTKIDDNIAKMYEKRSQDKTAEEFLKLMDAETWMNADEALAEGLVDEVSTEGGKTEARFAASQFENLGIKKAPANLVASDTEPIIENIKESDGSEPEEVEVSETANPYADELLKI